MNDVVTFANQLATKCFIQVEDNNKALNPTRWDKNSTTTIKDFTFRRRSSIKPDYWLSHSNALLREANPFLSK